ncbi:MAG: putative porin [Pseudomonadota bacterium]
MKRKLIWLALSCVLTTPALANERESLEALRQTTINLIDALVEQGVFSRDKADAMIKAAEKKAAATAKESAKAEAGRVRVQYVPEIVKTEIREQLKQEVLAQARTERWAEPNAIPQWVDTIKIEGDLRLSYRLDKFAKDNATPANFAFESFNDFVQTNTLPGALGGVGGVSGAGAEAGQTRAADLASVNSLGVANANSQQHRERLRLRARLGILARISEQWGAGLRLATGSTTDRVSTNQTLGQDFNKYSLLVDRAFLKYDPVDWFSVTGGRIPNPWFSTDLMWDDDLNFEGLAATFKPVFDNGAIKPFLTVGAFPIKEENQPASQGRWMHGIQGGTQWDFNTSTRLKIGVAWYGFRNFEGRVEDTSSLDVAGATFKPMATNYGQYEYSRNLRQKGNTLFRTNALGDTGTVSYWGLASRFRPLNLTAALDLAHFDPVHMVLTGDWVKNTAFDRGEILSRTQGRINLTDGKNYGYNYKLTLGMPKIKDARDWQVSAAYRFLGSDAVVDAFTDSDFGLGGTNMKGYTLGLQYGIDRNAALGLRWISADSIDSFTMNPAHRFSVDVMQADVNVRF